MTDLWSVFTAKRREIRAEYDNYLDSVYVAADADCKGVLVNRLGRKRGVDPRSLFYGPFARVEKYASEELYAWFERHGRWDYTTFEKHYLKGELHEG